MASDKAWLDGLREAMRTTGNITATVMTVGVSKALAAHAELERKVLAIKAVCPPEHLDAALREAEVRAGKVTAEEALDSVYADLTRGWLPPAVD